MYATTEQAKQAALRTLIADQQKRGRVVSPFVQRAILRTLPAKEVRGAR